MQVRCRKNGSAGNLDAEEIPPAVMCRRVAGPGSLCNRRCRSPNPRSGIASGEALSNESERRPNPLRRLGLAAVSRLSCNLPCPARDLHTSVVVFM